MAQRRAKVRSIQLTSRKSLVITSRNFRTAKAARSKTYKQYIIPVYLLTIKEIAIRYQQKKPKRRSKAANIIRRRRLQAAASVLLITIGIGGAIYFGVQANSVSNAKKLTPAKTFAVPPPAPKKIPDQFLSRSEPTHLKVPAVGIDAPVINVGKDAEGGIEVPPVLEWVTGWYKYSPTPGEKGPSVIVGHVDSYKGVSVFWRLREVTPGMEIQVTRADGKIATFKVDGLKQFDQANFPTAEVYGSINHAGLRLITCGGSFDKITGSYTQNTVVYASMVP